LPLGVLATSLLAAFGTVAVAVPSKAAPSSAVAETGLIAFATEGPHSQIYTVNPDGTGEKQLTHVAPGVQVDQPEWSPYADQIVYWSDASGTPDIWVMNSDGTDQHVLAHADGWDYSQPRWSPDGSEIAVVRCNEPFGYCDIDVMNADGSEEHRLVGGHAHNFDPNWAPNGDALAFASDRAGYVSAIWVKDLTGLGGLTRLSSPALEACLPDWSPDGAHLLFMSNCDRRFLHVYVMNSDGSAVGRLDQPPHQSSGFASYSPDGAQIVFASNRLPGPGADLFTMNADGTDAQPIVTTHPHLLFSDWGSASSTR
jgi:TolB protein